MHHLAMSSKWARQGIAVGMATNIPPHNLGEVIDATLALIENPDLTSEELMGYVPGPDFPTGGIMLGRSGARKAYLEGRGVASGRIYDTPGVKHEHDPDDDADMHPTEASEHRKLAALLNFSYCNRCILGMTKI